MQAQNGVLSSEQLRWVADWVVGAFCVASHVHGHHSVWVTDAWRVTSVSYLPGRNLDQHVYMH